MSARDLLQRRQMTASGDTSWQHTPLITAALNGHLCVLDGMHRLHHSTAMVLQRLVNERELELFDGTRLLPKEKFDAICTKTGFTAQQLKERYVLACSSHIVRKTIFAAASTRYIRISV